MYEESLEGGISVCDYKVYCIVDCDIKNEKKKKNICKERRKMD